MAQTKEGLSMKIAVLSACLLVSAACAASGGKATDWQAKIGQQSFEEVSRELGDPERCVDLDHGGTVCSWTLSKGKDWVDKLILTFDQQHRLATVDTVRL